MNIVDYEIDEFDFDFVKDSLGAVAEDVAEQIVNKIQEEIIDKAKDFIKNQFSELFGLEDLLINALTLFLPVETKLLYRLGFEWSQSVTLGVIPIIIGVVKVDAYIKYFHAIDITYGFEEGALFLGIGPHTGVSLGLTAYADFFILRLGMFVEGTLFDGAIDFKLGIQVMNQLSAYYYCDLDITAFKFAVGSQYQYLYITIRWRCWRMRIGWWKIRICYPVIRFRWSSWLSLIHI
eukprot:TRINITY_DN13496_c0_g1_i1.p1 TRINITY_DN13496_c0_g1~~TRINITY_DN13496_c0_g1_i1.p1  ORF type:complete len:235 (+),score=29.44 TRINITY_DN13496_c0_g1_i1:2-706(+)